MKNAQPEKKESITNVVGWGAEEAALYMEFTFALEHYEHYEHRTSYIEHHTHTHIYSRVNKCHV